jgi:hypothetical protein
VPLLLLHSFAMHPVRSAEPRSLDLERDLPPAGWRRWSALNKAAVVIAVRSGRLGRVEAYDRYMLSDDELSGWEESFDRDGIAGLRAKRAEPRPGATKR